MQDLNKQREAVLGVLHTETGTHPRVVSNHLKLTIGKTKSLLACLRNEGRVVISRNILGEAYYVRLPQPEFLLQRVWRMLIQPHTVTLE